MGTEKQLPAERRRRPLSIRVKLVVGFALLSAFVSFITARGMYTNLQKQIVNEFNSNALSIARLVSLQQDGNELIQIISPQDALYAELLLRNQKIQSIDPAIRSLFVLRKDETGIYYVMTAGGERNAAFGDRYRDPSKVLIDSFDNMTDAVAESAISTDQAGSLLSAYAPILLADGEHVGVIGVDISADTILQQQRQILNQAILVFFVALGLGLFAGYVAGNALTEPILALTKGASAFASGKLDEYIEIETGDEIEDLTNVFNSMAGDIRGLISGLEQRVAERTAELETRSKELEIANENTRRRAEQFESMAQVAQTITSIHDLKELLPRVASVISEYFGFYHVGVFLVDEADEYAVLTAANSEGGKRMLERMHRLKVGEQGIVGRVTGTGEPRIALNVGKDAVYFNNPDLPDTHSEMALPLRSGDKIIGALDVQSTEANAFTNEDVQTLSLLADQVSLAIENARLFEDSNRTLADLQMIMRQSTREAWKRLPEQQRVVGYRYNAMGSTPLTESINLAEPQTGREKAGGDDTGSYVVPIELRGEVIGSLLVQSPSGDAWNDDERDLIKAVAERVALSAENARLFDETTQRAERERLVSEITGKIRSHNDPKAMIETAINELRNALGATRVEVIPQSSGGKDSKV